MRKACLAALIAGLVSAAAMGAPYTGTWNQTWDFSTGLQGWALGTAGATGSWVDPAVSPSGPTLPDGGASNGGAANLYLPDKSYARIDVSACNLGSTDYGRNGFVYQADVYIPNLRPLNGFNWDYPGNMNHQAGIGAMRASDGKGIFAEGYINNGQVRVRDYTWDNSWQGPSWTMEETVSPDTLWWDKWITIQIDYSYSAPGKFSAYAYIPWTSPVAPAGWVTLATDRVCNLGDQFVTLQLGGTASWTQAQFDNAKLAYLPEPAGLLLLGLGAIAALRRRR